MYIHVDDLSHLKGTYYLSRWFNVKIVLLVATLFAHTHAIGTHIVGGNFELLHLGESTYRLTLIFYFDAVNGHPGAKDDFVNVKIVSKSKSQPTMSITLPLESESFTNTVSNSCENNTQLKIRVIRYSSRITIEPSYFNNGGFYVAFERCCRNTLIKNIEKPLQEGMVFYMELKDSTNNNSPIWPTPPRFYGCKNIPLNLNFSAYDLDGDSLIYEMVPPKAGNIKNTDPKAETTISPYPLVNFLPGYTFDRAIAGNPSLGIDYKKGILGLNAYETGIFVFAVALKEYRKGKLISTTHKEFQLVIWNCKDQEPPVVLAKSEQKPVNHLSTIEFYSDKNNCFELLYTSKDNLSFLRPQWTTDSITSSYVPKNLTSGYPNDTLRQTICLPKCVFGLGYVSKFYIVVSKEQCGLYTFDTLSFQIEWKDSTQRFDPASVPNIFTPNGDGHNDVFAFEIPDDNCTQTFQDFEITNRWGESLYKTSSKKIHWAADLVSEGNYFYTLSFAEKKYKGFIHLLR